MKTCKKCGKEVANDVRFCTYCGEAFEQDTAKPQIVSPDEMEKKEAFRKIKQETEDMYSESRQTQERINAENSYPKRKGKKRFVVVPVILALLALIAFGVDYFGPVKYIPRDFGDCLGRDIDYIQKKYQMSAYGDEDINDLLGVYVCGNAAVYDTDDDGTIDVISLGEISDENVLYSKDLYKIDGLKYGMSKKEAEEVLYDLYERDVEVEDLSSDNVKYYWSPYSEKMYKITYKQNVIHDIFLYKR
ncbi:MAG: zinc ribbon domain-containing protein [Clostridiaceae bacterium]|nr:zinc ribbon domain-containing protein [Clostridiaceae bacterium]